MIDTTVFTVPRGETIKIPKSVYVFASTSVDIEGRLVADDGVTVAFFTPSFTIGGGGSLGFSFPSHVPAVYEVVSACSIIVKPGAKWIVAPGDTLLLVSDSASTGQDHCNVYVGESVQLAGANAGDTDSPNGENGGSIEIGTSHAIGYANVLAAAHGHGTIKSYAPAVLSLNATLAAGAGGSGLVDPTGTLTNGTYVFTGGNGGKGGSVTVGVEKILGAGGQLLAGNGGNAGTIGASVAYSLTGPLNGTPTSPNGIPATINMGAGGAGGSIAPLPRHVSDNLSATAGNGGNASIVTSKTGTNSFFAGAGYTPTMGLGASPGYVAGNGGSVKLNLALPGAAGTGGYTTASDGKYVAMTFSGGGGGNPGGGLGGIAYVATFAPGTFIAGGNGASLTIVRPAGVTPNVLVSTYGLSIMLANFGTGGDSFMGGANPNQAPFSVCPSPPPAGIAGGNGGSLHDSGVWPVLYPALSNFGYGMGGGQGSAGHPVGAVGANGYDDEGGQIGQTQAPSASLSC